MKQYSWRKHGVAGCSAQTAGQVLEMIEERDGEITKEAFLEESRPENSPTHNCFEWNDSEAAEKYRLQQARFIITNISVKIVADNEEKKEKKTYAFLNVSNKVEPGSYRSVHVAMSNQSSRETILNNALLELKAFECKYNNLKELAPVFSSISEVEKTIKGGKA